MASPLPSSFVFFFLLSATTLPLYVYGSGGFSVDLIHRDSPKSPLYDPSLSLSDRLRAAAHRSRARADYFRLSTAAANDSSSFESEVIPNSFEYLMTLNVGTPPFKILAIADTGSDLTWTQCKPCTNCYEQKDPMFDPKKSSTYGTVSCNADSCSQLPEGGCGSGSLCEYHYTYGDQSYTDGILSSETFTFDSEGRRTVSIPKVLFGCSHESNGTFDENGGGLVGLGGGPLSLVSQLGSSIDNKFSYCLVPYSNDNNETSLLNFGDKALFDGPDVTTTPIVRGDPDTFYYLSLEEIRVENHTISAARKRSGSSSTSSSSKAVGDGNIIIDSGTTLTLLDDSVLQPLVDKLSEVVNLPTVKDSDGLFDLCFDVSGSSGGNVELPDINFIFSGGPVVLSPLNTFVQPSEGVICLGMISSGGLGGLAIFGNIAQQNFHIGYDLAARKIHFAPQDCTKL